MDQKNKTTICLQVTHFKYNDTYRKVNEWRKTYHANTNNQKEAGVAVLISKRTDLRARKVIRDKEGHYIIIKESILQDIMYAPNNRASKYVRQKQNCKER